MFNCCFSFWRRLVPALLLCLPLFGTQAQEAAASSGKLSLALGVGRYNSLMYQGQDVPLYLLPRWSYYGERFYIEDLNLGFNLLESDSFSWDLTTKQSFDALMFRQDNSLNDSLLAGLTAGNVLLALPSWESDPKALFHLKERHFSYLAGSTLFWRHGDWQFSSALHADVSNVHGGLEWNNQLRYLTKLGPLDVATTVGGRWLDSHYSNYHFGITRLETSRVWSSRPDAQWLPSLKLELSWPLDEDLRLIGSWRREWLSSAFDNSYFLASKTHDIWFIGVMKTW
ncbi:MipA/OmpV family protein [Shewanella sedimentimangrovi]|uniref:MipA/OmpV family protein n=1 Tax=Shewanella sedimentimangrovi TaxID=2814293 RepID=A0ABX7R1W8_9GAMM|nr:MipA/OmpV family protein [Shewanella sedimentimangrovi]QSX37689.1 MipA/OmpV family protein [Shewanella sedimentimangrovi]